MKDLVCPWCGVESEEPSDHEDWCPSNTGLRKETIGTPSYMKNRPLNAR